MELEAGFEELYRQKHRHASSAELSSYLLNSFIASITDVEHPQISSEHALETWELINVPQFPPELIDTILSYVADDRTTLVSSSLVSRAWVPFARKYLFSEVYLTRVNARTLYIILQSAHCTITSFRSLDISFSGECSLLVNILIPLISSRLVVRDSLTLRCAAFSEKPGLLAGFSKSEAFGSISKLKMDVGYHTDKLYRLVTFASTFKELSCLELKGPFLRSTKACPQLSTSLTHLSLISAHESINQLLLQKPLLKSLSIRDIVSSNVKALQTYLETATALEYLCLMPDSREKAPIVNDLHDLPRIQVLVLSDQHRHPKPIQYIVTTLSTLHVTAYLQKLILYVNPYSSFYEDELTWIKLDTVLASLGQRINNVTIYAITSEGEVAKKWMIESSKRGVSFQVLPTANFAETFDHLAR